MPLTGTIPITRGQSIVPPTSWFEIGSDLNRYTISGTQGVDSTAQIKVGCAETNSTIWTLNDATWRATIASASLVGSAGVIAGNLFGMDEGPIPIPGTNQFYVGGNGSDGTNTYSIFVRYTIASSSSVVVDNIYAYKSTSNPEVAGWCFGSAVIDGELFSVSWLFNGTYLVRLPISAGGVENSATVWNARRTSIGTVFGDTLGQPTYFIADDYFNRCAILKAPASNSVRILTYRSGASLPGNGSNLTTAGSEYVDVNWSAQTVGSLTSAQSALGQPWSDEGLGYGGTTTSDNFRNRYTGPTALSNIVIFGRVFVDDTSINRFRRYTYNEATGNFTAVDTFEVTISGGHSQDSVGVLAAIQSGQLLVARYGVGRWNLGQITLGDPVETGEEGPGECGSEDVADELLSAITWPKCDLAPSSIKVEIVSQSVSPGRSFTGIEKVVQPDAGCWRITLGDVPIRTKADILRWRETESGCNGRSNPIMVPVYEAPLSDEPIAASPTHAHLIGESVIDLEQSAGEDIRAGMHFSDGTWLYRVARVVIQSASLTTIAIIPPLRADMDTDTALDFNDPHCRCRLETDDGMDVNLELLRFSTPTVAFLEDV